MVKECTKNITFIADIQKFLGRSEVLVTAQGLPEVKIPFNRSFHEHQIFANNIRLNIFESIFVEFLYKRLH